MVRNNEHRKRAIVLRERGYSFPRISRDLGGIPKATLSYWLKDVVLSSIQKEAIRQEGLSHLAKARARALAVRRERRLAYFENIKEEFKYLGKKLWHRDSARIALATLYLAEGGKTQLGSLSFGNSDPRIIRLFLRLLRFCYTIDESKLRCTVQCRADQDFGKLERFWGRITKIPRPQFYATRADPRSKGRRTVKVHYKGVCKIDYFSARIFHEITVIGGILTD